jgi:hypothetical protein
LPFEEQRTSGSHFAFPIRTFALPLRTAQVTLGVLTGRCFVVTLHTLLILGPVLSIEEPELLAGTVLATITVTIYIQAAAFFAARDSILLAIAKVSGCLAPVVLVCFVATAPIVAPPDRTIVASLLAILPGVALNVCAAKHARHGSLWSVRFSVQGLMDPTVRFQSAILARVPISPVWTQAWFEFRSTAIWFTVIHWSVALPFILLLALTYRGQLEAFELNTLSAAGLGLAMAVGFLWEKPNRVALRFSMARPLADEHVALARITAGFVAVLLSLAGILTSLAVALFIRALLGFPMLPREDALPFLLTFPISSAPIWWCALAIGRIVPLVAIAMIPTIGGAVVVFEFLGINSEFFVMAYFFTVLPLTLAGLGRFTAKRLNTSGNWILLCALSLVPVFLLAHFHRESEFLMSLVDWSAIYLFPLFIAVATLFFAYSSEAISKVSRNDLLLLVALATPLLALLMKLQPYNAGLLDSSGAAYLAAGLVLPFVWFPLLARFQRTG